MTRPFYKVVATRRGGWWAIDVPEIIGGYGQAAEQSEIEAIARGIVATMLDVEPESFDLEIMLNQPAGASRGA